MKEIIERLKSETPLFWKKFRAFALSLGGSAAAVWGLNATMELELPLLIITICKYTLVICAAVAGTSSLAKKDQIT